MPDNIFTTIEQLFGDQIINNRLNPVHLAIARHGYQIQSHTLGIPDRFGLFSPGPPRLQVAQGFLFVTLSMIYGSVAIWGVIAVFMVKAEGRPVFKLSMGMAALVIVPLILIWIMVCFDHRRSPGYKWEEDWKLRIA